MFDCMFHYMYCKWFRNFLEEWARWEMVYKCTKVYIRNNEQASSCTNVPVDECESICARLRTVLEKWAELGQLAWPPPGRVDHAAAAAATTGGCPRCARWPMGCAKAGAILQIEADQLAAGVHLNKERCSSSIVHFLCRLYQNVSILF
jgi:hypothetical protein